VVAAAAAATSLPPWQPARQQMTVLMDH
jgi:hypothetical protein